MIAPTPDGLRQEARSVSREVSDRVLVLRAKRDAIYAVQVEMLKLYCALDRAAAAVEREERVTEESARLLREARRWLGPGVRESVA